MISGWVGEPDYDGHRLQLAVEEVLYEGRTAFQDVAIVRTESFGRMLILDGVFQTTERDEFIYHEMLVHVPLVAHSEAADVLIIGGGDGGALREVLKHPVARVKMVEIDREVVELCRQYLPSLSAGGFDDPRVTLEFADGVQFAADGNEIFDVIIVDSTDPYPEGPGTALFTSAFYASCNHRLRRPGVLVAQHGIPFMHLPAVAGSIARLADVFADASTYIACIPTYSGGYMAFGWGANDPGLRRRSNADLSATFEQHAIDTRFYSPEFHRAAFTLPRTLGGGEPPNRSRP